MDKVKKLGEFENEKYLFRLHYFPGDNSYVINKLLKSNKVVRGRTILVSHKKDKARTFFEDLEKKGGEQNA